MCQTKLQAVVVTVLLPFTGVEPMGTTKKQLTCGFSIVLLGSSSAKGNANAQSTRHGPRLGPKLAPWCTGGPPAYPAAESGTKLTGPGESVQM